MLSFDAAASAVADCNSVFLPRQTKAFSYICLQKIKNDTDSRIQKRSLYANIEQTTGFQ